MKLRTRLFAAAGPLAWVALTVSVLTGSAYGWVWWLSLFAFLATWIVSRILGSDVAEKSAGVVDEYESVRRARARGLGYRVAMIGGVVLVVVFSIFAAESKAGRPDLLLLAPDLLMASVLAIASLPTFAIAWSTRSGDE